MASSSSTSEHQNPLVPVAFTKDVNGLDKVILREASGVSAEIYLYGAHVTAWKNEKKEELLFVSKKILSLGYSLVRANSRTTTSAGNADGLRLLRPKVTVAATFKPPKPIHGGISICFPQFCNHGILEAHGFARNRVWSVDPNPPPFPINSPNKSYVDLVLKSSEEDLKILSHGFEFRLRVTLGPGGNLTLRSRVKNTASKRFTFTFAYHTHFSVSDISEVRVEGLETSDYLDNTRKRKQFTEQGDAITFEGEVDKIYLSTSKIAIMDHKWKRTFVIRKDDGLPDAVVWNPWDKKAKAMADFGDDEYKHMLCVEAAAIENPINLKPDEEWKGRQELSAVPSILGT